MERLTFEGNFCDIAQCQELPCPYNGNCAQREVWERLEDTELTPEDIEELKRDWSELCTIIGECGGLARLREFVKAEKDGRVVVLPCKAGDTVYEVTSRKTISEYRVKAIRVELFCTFIEWDITAGFVDKSIFGVPVDEIGKTVFLTREEVEEALEAKRDVCP